ncbi:MAG: hypothetical protein MN733_02660 [Nitrososphaera sp.]|nr:hypothetical protein [Nitrososphaera sp.]
MPSFKRPFSGDLRLVLEAWKSGEAYIVLATFQHPDISSPVYLANNNEDVVSNGITYIGFPFEIEVPGEFDGPPRGTMTIQNVDRKIGYELQKLKTPPILELQVVLASAPDDVWLSFKHFWFRNITGNAISIQGEIDSWDFASDPWPARIVTQDRFPGLFR